MAPGRGSGSRHPSASRGAQGDRLGERKGQAGVFQHWGIAKCRERAKGLSYKPLGEQRPCCGGRSQFEFLARLASIQARASSLILKPNGPISATPAAKLFAMPTSSSKGLFASVRS